MHFSRGGQPRITSLLLFVLALSACGQTDSGDDSCGTDEICGADSAERVRSIKPHVVTQLATGSERRFSGEVAAANAAPLSFAVGGRVMTIDVSAGDAVGSQALLASLDSAPFELNVESARADLKAARSAETALATDLERQRELRKNGWVSQAALDQAEVE